MSLYDDDFYLWTKQQTEALKAGRLNELDLVNLADEVESLGIRERRDLRQAFGVMLLHLLKREYGPEGHGYEPTYKERILIQATLESSPSLLEQIPERVTAAYETARRLAISETELPPQAFPEICPWTPEQLLDEAFWIEG